MHECTSGGKNEKKDLYHVMRTLQRALRVSSSLVPGLEKNERQ